MSAPSNSSPHPPRPTMTAPHTRAPIRSTTFDHEGWIRAQQQRRNPELEILSEGSPAIEHVACPPPPKVSPPSILLANACWETDIVTFCSHIRHDPLLRRAHITEIQNRKSRKLPHLQEYLLLFFAVGQRRFVARIDFATRSRAWFNRSAKQHPEAEAPLSGLSGQAARPHVTIYHATSDEATPWFDADGRRGSELVATLSTWADLGVAGTTFVSHHLSTARDVSSGRPSLQDVSRLIEAVILEAPSSHFKTVSSFVTARSSLLVIQRCFPHDFACQLGEERELVPASALEEPSWASLLRWYLPFTFIALSLYAIAVVALHIWVAHLLGSSKTSKHSIGNRVGVLEAAEKCMLDQTAPECAHSDMSAAVWQNGLRLMLHLMLDLPFPVGLLHTWLMSTEMRMGGLVRRVSSRFLDEGVDVSDDSMMVKTAIGSFSRPWFNFVVWTCLGCLVGSGLFIGILLGQGVIVLLCFVIFAALIVNYMLPPMDTGDEVPESPEDGLPLLDCDSPLVRTSGSEPDLHSVAGPSSSRL
ncbi:hypothetical protein BDV93DRAFT_520196 [Ceratobasidium sp. AG-I]|nr:hypothetical protein BDV93DRAFT_520196 [Ceratobasidium sp. AG-I]